MSVDNGKFLKSCMYSKILGVTGHVPFAGHKEIKIVRQDTRYTCLLYTSDAADDMQCVDLGGRRIIKKRITFRST